MPPVSTTDYPLGSWCSPVGQQQCLNSIEYHCVQNITSKPSWEAWRTQDCSSPLNSNNASLLEPIIGAAGVSPCYPIYQSGSNYPQGSIVSFNGVNYQSKYYTNGNPTTGTDWTTLGSCDANSLKPRPYSGKPGVIGYWAQWSGYSRPQNTLDKLDLTGFSAINYAFLKPLPDGTLVSFDAYADSLHVTKLNGVVRIKYPKLRTLISIGGWSGSSPFSTIASSAGTINTFVKSVAHYLDQNGFDGVDLDWEYPAGGGLACNVVSPNDAINFVTLLQALRTELGPTRIISIAMSANTDRYQVNGTNYIPQYAKQISYFQIMTYDFYGSWSPYSDFNSPLNSPSKTDPKQPSTNGVQYSISGGINAYTKLGVSKNKLVAGLAFYGRSWQVQPNPPQNGLYQKCQGTVSGDACVPIVGDVLDVSTYPDACGDQYHSTVWMYMNLRGDSRSGNAAYTQPNAPLANGPTTASNGWTRKYFKFAESPTLYHPNYRGAPTFISYDDPTSIKAKSTWAKKKGLGGVMVWEIDQDYRGEMIRALTSGWGK
ncbi:glycoside hydrolase superfamily [Obelidium mucronatum]|nr:glycoside hydrolase superfamily [Obelidium mucronatum]